MKGFKNTIKKNMIAGLLVTIPAGLTYMSFKFVVKGVDNSMNPIMHKILGESQMQFLESHSIPGVGLLIIFLFIMLVGLLGANFIGLKFVSIGENLLNKIPYVRAIYTSIKKVIQTVSQTDNPTFEKMALLTYPREPLKTLGIVCCTARGEIAKVGGDDLVNVFVPTSPNPTTGYLLLVPIKDLQLLDMSVEDGLKMIISFGMVKIEENNENINLTPLLPL